MNYLRKFDFWVFHSTVLHINFLCELNRLTQYFFVYSLLVFGQHVSAYVCHLQVTLGTYSRVLKYFSTGAYIIIVTYSCVIGLFSLVTILCVVIIHFCCVGTVYSMCCRFTLCFVDCLLLLLSLFCIIIWVFYVLIFLLHCAVVLVFLVVSAGWLVTILSSQCEWQEKQQTINKTQVKTTTHRIDSTNTTKVKNDNT
jgi:hypothetical protein